MSDKSSRIEAIVSRRVKRDITRMTELMKGNLEKAAESILDSPNAHVGIVTGFFIKHATPPSPETDGLIGMGHLAAGSQAQAYRLRLSRTHPAQRRCGPWSMPFRSRSISR